MNRFNKNQENNATVQHAFDKIILQDNEKLSAEDEAYENINSEIDENYLYKIDNMSLYEKKEWRKRAFESELEYIYDTKRHNSM